MSSCRRRYRVSSESLSLSIVDMSPSLTYEPNNSSDQSGHHSANNSSTTPRKSGHNFTRKRLSSLFATISLGSGLNKLNHSHVQDPISLESYRSLSPTACLVSSVQDRLDIMSADKKPGNCDDKIARLRPDREEHNEDDKLEDDASKHCSSVVSGDHRSSMPVTTGLQLPLTAAKSLLGTTTTTSPAVTMSSKLSKKVSRSRTALNWPFKKLLRSESSNDSGVVVSGPGGGTGGGVSSAWSPDSSPTAAQSRLFGQPLELLCPDGQTLPKPVTNMLKQLFLKGPHTMGIFRKSASAKTIRELKARLEDEPDFPLDEASIMVIGSIFKEFLRSLPGSLLDTRLYRSWMSAANLTNNQEAREAVQGLLRQLPPLNCLLLRHFLCVLWHIAQKAEENKMSSMNLAVCVGQSLLANGPSGLSCAQRCEEVSKCVPKLIAYLIDHCSELFDGAPVLQLFGPSPLNSSSAGLSGPTSDSGADEEEESDSLNSLHDQNGSSENSSDRVRRCDDSSIDSLERDSDESSGSSSGHAGHRSGHRSVVLQRIKSGHGSPAFANKMSLSNLSRDSGLTLSDTQLYNQEDENLDPRQASASVSPKPLKSGILNSSKSSSHFTKSVPHLDAIESYENALNVTYSYGRSIGVSIDGSCHDVVRKRKHAGLFVEKEPRHKSSTAQNIGTPSRLRSPLNSHHHHHHQHSPHHQGGRSVNNGHPPLSRPGHRVQVPVSVDIHEEPRADETPRLANYRFRRPPLSVLLGHGDRRDRRTLNGGTPGQPVTGARLESSPGGQSGHVLRRTASVESIPSSKGGKNSSNHHRSQHFNEPSYGVYGQSSAEPQSLPYQLIATQGQRMSEVRMSEDVVDCAPRTTSTNKSVSTNPDPGQCPQSGRKAQRISSICSASSETPSNRSAGSKHSVKSSLSSCSIRSNPLSVAPPSYQDTMIRKEQLARMVSTPSGSRKLSTTSSAPTDNLYEESLRVYSQDMSSGSNLTLRAVPVRVAVDGAKSVATNGSKSTVVKVTTTVPSGEVNVRQEKSSQSAKKDEVHANLNSSPGAAVVQTRCAKDLSDDWRSNVHWSVAHLRTLFSGAKLSPLSTAGHRPVSVSQSALVKTSFDRIDGHYNKKNLMVRSSLDLTVTSGHVTSPSLSNNNGSASKCGLFSGKGSKSRDAASCVTVIRVTPSKSNSSNSLKVLNNNVCDSLSSGEESYV